VSDYIAPRDDAIRDLRRQVDQLQGRVDTLLALLQGKGAEVASPSLRAVK
jgi:hypothetical protein